MGTNITIRDALRDAQGYLDKEVSYLESQLILGHVLKKSRSWLIAHDDIEVSQQDLNSYIRHLEHRASGYPIAYLLGTQEFWSLELAVNDATLIPRPDTECLVEAILNMHPATPCTILDLGTGSGAIALALASEHKSDTVIAMDRSDRAVATARENQQRLSLSNVYFFIGEWGDSLAPNSMDIVVSNPPYICERDHHLQDLKHEPLSALASGTDGLDDIRAICSRVGDYLKPNGILALEHGYDQQEEVIKLLNQQGFKDVTGHLDLSEKPRFVTGIAP